jgi:pilus assembly protein CpaF
MRSYEAYAAQETARTGHTVITTIHSNNALDAYDRMVTMAQLYPGNRLNEDKLTSLMLKAFPVIVYMKMLDDGNRRIMEIMEGEHYTRENGLKCHTLYRYNVETTEQKGKKTIVHGQHERVSGISENLQRTLLNNGAERKIVDQYAD